MTSLFPFLCWLWKTLKAKLETEEGWEDSIRPTKANCLKSGESSKTVMITERVVAMPITQLVWQGQATRWEHHPVHPAAAQPKCSPFHLCGCRTGFTDCHSSVTCVTPPADEGGLWAGWQKDCFQKSCEDTFSSCEVSESYWDVWQLTFPTAGKKHMSYLTTGMETTFLYCVFFLLHASRSMSIMYDIYFYVE